MLNWIKHIFNSKEKAAPLPVSTAQNNFFVADKDTLSLSPEIENFLNANGPELTMKWLLDQLVANMSGSQSAAIFSGYYDNHCSKRDILDKYDEIIIVDTALLQALVKLGDYYDANYISSIYETNISFCVISPEFLSNLAEQLAHNAISLRQLNDKLYEEFFFFVKSSLSLAQKLKTNMNITIAESEPIDEIEATLIKLLSAERNYRV